MNRTLALILALILVLVLALITIDATTDTDTDATPVVEADVQAEDLNSEEGVTAHQDYLYCWQEGYNLLEQLALPRMTVYQMNKLADYSDEQPLENLPIWAEAVGNQPEHLDPSIWETEMDLFQDLWQAIKLAQIADYNGEIQKMRQANDACDQTRIKVEAYLALRDGDLQEQEPEIQINELVELAEDAPDWVREQVKYITSGYKHAGPLGWGTCQFENQAADCLWVAWTDYVGHRKMEFNQVLPDEMRLEFQARGRAFFGQALDSPQIRRSYTCYQQADDETKITQLVLSTGCGGLGNWVNTKCIPTDCDRHSVTDELVHWFNSSGLGLSLTLSQYVY